MTNTKIISHSFEYLAPGTLLELLSSLQKPGSMCLAGGTDLVNRLKLKTAAPQQVIYIGKVEGLMEFSADDSGLHIGAMVPMRTVETNSLVQKDYIGLHSAINSVGGMQIRNTATIAGNIANASPAADTPPPLMTLRAECRLASMKGNEVSYRNVAVEKIFTGPGSTVLEEDECIVSINVPKPEGDYGTSFLRSARVKLDVAKANCAVFLQRDGKECSEIRIAAGAVAPMPIRVPHVEEALRGKKIDSQTIKKAAALIGEDIQPIEDVRSTVRYRMRVMKVLIRDAVFAAWANAGGRDFREGKSEEKN
jgi:CO/xanthine dehydrogenase FAD-binding subunit